MKKRIVSLILALMLILSLTACAKDGGEIARDSRNGVVRIFVEGIEGVGVGSAFGVGNDGSDRNFDDHWIGVASMTTCALAAGTIGSAKMALVNQCDQTLLA